MFLFLISVIVFYFIIAFICSSIISNKITTTDPLTKTIFVTTNGIHTSLIIPFEAFNDYINYKDYKGYSEQQYIMIGWGDEDFYMNVPEWKDLTVKVVLSSIFLPTNSAMHVTFYNQPIEDNDTKKIMISKSDYDLLVNEIKGSFLLLNNKPILYQNQGYSTKDNFYKANGNYHAFNTCNSWTNRVLDKSNQSNALWTPFPFTVMGLCE